MQKVNHIVKYLKELTVLTLMGEEVWNAKKLDSEVKDQKNAQT